MTQRYIVCLSENQQGKLIKFLWLRRVVLTISLFGWYTYLGFFFHYDVFLIAGVALFAMFRVKWDDIRIIGGFVLIGGVSILPTLFDMQLRIGLNEQFSSLALLGLTILASLGLFKSLVACGRSFFHLIFFMLSVVVLTAAVLEVIGLLRPLSDAFRERVYPDWLLYTADWRDLDFAGFVRPKVFTSEPSFVANGLAVFLIAAALTASSIFRNIIILAMCSFGIIIIGSPVMLGAAIFLVFNMLVLHGSLKIVKNPVLGALLFGGIAVFGLGALPVASMLAERLGMGGTPLEPSIFLRLHGPVLSAYHALGERPLLGFGIGAQENVMHIYRTVLDLSITPDFLFRGSPDGSFILLNNHALLVLQLGLLGSLFWILMWQFAASALLGQSLKLFWAFYAIYGMGAGGFHGPPFWGGLLIVLAALRLRKDAGPRFAEATFRWKRFRPERPNYSSNQE